MEFYATRTGLKPATAKYVQELDSALTDAWLVFEAVPERLAIKKSTFADLERLAPEDAILCSNSSSYKSADMLDELQNSKTKERILNTHYLMPPKLQVVEIMGDGFTNPAIIQFVAEQHKIAGCHPYVSQVQSTGFIINRIWAAIKRETLQVLAEGVISPAELDAIYKETLGTPLGPCKLMDGKASTNVPISVILSAHICYSCWPRHSRIHRRALCQGAKPAARSDGRLAPEEFRQSRETW